MRPGWSKPRPWTASDLDRLRSLYPGTGLAEVAIALGRSFPSVRSKAKVLQLGCRKFWTPEEVEDLRKLYPDTPNAEIARILGRTRSAIDGAGSEFGLSKTESYLKAHARLQKGSGIGAAYRFQPGIVPHNKGMRRPGYSVGRMAETQFKKGGRPHNTRPVGTVLQDHEGYLRMKVKERGPGERGWHPTVWPLAHHLVWIQHNGPIPAGHAIAFKDGNRENCTIENLQCIRRGDLARKNAMWNRYPQELIEVILLSGSLKRKLRRLARGEK